MFPTLYLLTLLTQLGDSPKPPPHDRINAVQSGAQGTLSWEDAEDKVTGSFSPWVLEAGKPLDVVVRVGAMQGAPFEGPVTLTLKPQNSQGGGDTQTVKMTPQAKAWAASLKTTEPGPYWLEIAWATTHHKVVRAEVTVQELKLPRWPWYVLLGLAGAATLVMGVRSAIGKKT
jgi:hypothetical protein